MDKLGRKGRWENVGVGWRPEETWTRMLSAQTISECATEQSGKLNDSAKNPSSGSNREIHISCTVAEDWESAESCHERADILPPVVINQVLRFDIRQARSMTSYMRILTRDVTRVCQDFFLSFAFSRRRPRIEFISLFTAHTACAASGRCNFRARGLRRERERSGAFRWGCIRTEREREREREREAAKWIALLTRSPVRASEEARDKFAIDMHAHGRLREWRHVFALRLTSRRVSFHSKSLFHTCIYVRISETRACIALSSKVTKQCEGKPSYLTIRNYYQDNLDNLRKLDSAALFRRAKEGHDSQ